MLIEKIRKEIYDDKMLMIFDEIIKRYNPSEKQLLSTLHTIKVILQLLSFRKLVQLQKGQPYPIYVNILMTAAVAYYATYSEENPITSLFKAREDLTKFCDTELRMETGTIDALFATVEAARGDNGVPRCKPVFDGPAGIFSIAIWIVENYKRLGADNIE